MESGTVKKRKSQIVKLNVGGRKYTTTRSTLEMRGENFFTRMLANDDVGCFPCEKDEEGYIFIDRNGRTFEYVLDYMRSGEILVETDTQRIRVETDLDFFLGGRIKESSSETPRAGEKFFATCEKIEKEIVEEIDRNAEAIEKSIQDALLNCKFEWILYSNSDRTCWANTIFGPAFKIRLDCDNTMATKVMTREFEKRWALKLKEHRRGQMEFDLSHFMDFC